MNYLHENHIVHKDIKLENIMIANKHSEIIKIIDFGAANFFINDFKDGDLTGTVNFFFIKYILINVSLEKKYMKKKLIANIVCLLL